MKPKSSKSIDIVRLSSRKRSPSNNSGDLTSLLPSAAKRACHDVNHLSSLPSPILHHIFRFCHLKDLMKIALLDKKLTLGKPFEVEILNTYDRADVSRKKETFSLLRF